MDTGVHGAFSLSKREPQGGGKDGGGFVRPFSAQSDSTMKISSYAP